MAQTMEVQLRCNGIDYRRTACGVMVQTIEVQQVVYWNRLQRYSRCCNGIDHRGIGGGNAADYKGIACGVMI